MGEGEETYSHKRLTFQLLYVLMQRGRRPSDSVGCAGLVGLDWASLEQPRKKKKNKWSGERQVTVGWYGLLWLGRLAQLVGFFF
jgi:hypothetical protein